jgi:hypothetical protein
MNIQHTSNITVLCGSETWTTKEQHKHRITAADKIFEKNRKIHTVWPQTESSHHEKTQTVLEKKNSNYKHKCTQHVWRKDNIMKYQPAGKETLATHWGDF